MPADQRPILGGRRGHHSEHLGHLLAVDAISCRAPIPTRSGKMAEHFHALRVAEIVPETDEANSIRFEVPAELREAFAFKAGQHLTLRARHRRRGSAAQLFALHRAGRAGLDGDRQAHRRRHLFQLGWRHAEGRRHDRRDAAARQLHDRVRVRRRARYVGYCRRFGNHAGNVADPDRAAARSRDSRFTLFYGNRDSSSIIFLEALAELKDRYLGRLRTLPFPRRGRGRHRPVQRHARPSPLRRSDRASGRRSGKASTPGSSAVPAR